jgi:hypothetical protein
LPPAANTRDAAVVANSCGVETAVDRPTESGRDRNG